MTLCSARFTFDHGSVRHLLRRGLLVCLSMASPTFAQSGQPQVRPSTSAPTEETGPSNAECANAYESGQRLRRQGALVEAADQFEICADPRCPAAATQDCVTWLDEVRAERPSLDIEIRSSSGAPLPSAQISVDGRPISTGENPIPLNPGEHTVGATAPGHEPREAVIFLRLGEQAKPLTLMLSEIAAQEEAAPVPPPGPTRAPTSQTPRHRGAQSPPAALESRPFLAPPPPVVYVLAGLGVTFGGASTYFFVDAFSDISQMEDTCRPNCSPTEINRAETKLVAGHVTAGIAGASLVGAALTWLLTPRPRSNSAGRGSAWATTITTRGVSASWSAQF